MSTRKCTSDVMPTKTVALPVWRCDLLVHLAVLGLCCVTSSRVYSQNGQIPSAISSLEQISVDKSDGDKADGGKTDSQSGDQAKVNSDDVKNWIEQLSSSNFSERESALAKLAEQGESILPQLKRSLGESDDLERNTRLGDLISFIEDNVVSRRLDEFLRDPNPTDDHGLKAWQKFSAIAGKNRAAKQLLIEMYREHPQIMENSVEQNAVFIESTSNFAAEVRTNLNGPSLGDGLTLLYLAATLPQPVAADLQATAAFCCRLTPLSQKLVDERSKAPLGKIISSWMSRIDVNDSLLAERLLLLGMQADIEESRELARRVLESQNPDDRLIAAAFQTFTRFGTDQDLPLIESFFADDNILADNIYPDHATETRDLALVTGLVIRKQQPSDFFALYNSSPYYGFVIESVGFSKANPQKRMDAFEQYSKLFQ